MSIWQKSFMFRNSVRDCCDPCDQMKFFYDQYIKNYELIIKAWDRVGVSFPYKKEVSFDEFCKIWNDN